MRGFISEIKAEKDKVDEDYKHYIYMEKPITHFPYTHGDSLEVAREHTPHFIIREERGAAESLTSRRA